MLIAHDHSIWCRDNNVTGSSCVRAVAEVQTVTLQLLQAFYPAAKSQVL